mmetsp:Transcript_113221/g.316350  ORF Transcript_113221/g.316350 Transcript_113221/m.316350 type:complete len:503 (-) Transcript_113221:201-1709(-)
MTCGNRRAPAAPSIRRGAHACARRRRQALQLRGALPLGDVGDMVVVVGQARDRLVHPPRGEARWGWRGWRRRRRLRPIRRRRRDDGPGRHGGGRGPTLQRGLPELALILREHHLACGHGSREHQDAVGAVLRILRLLGRVEGHESPLSAWLATRFQVDVRHLAVLRKLCPKLGIRDVVRQGPDEDLLRTLGHDLLNLRLVGRMAVRRLLRRDGVLAEHALVPRDRHLARLHGTWECQNPVATILGVLRLVRRCEVHEGPLPAGLAPRLDVDLRDLTILAELGHEHAVVDVVWQGPDEDLPRSIRRHGLVLLVVRRARPMGKTTMGLLHLRWLACQRALAEHALVAREGHLARLHGPLEHEDIVRRVARHLSLLGGLEVDERPLPARLAPGLEVDLLDVAKLGKLRAQGALRHTVGQGPDEYLLRSLDRGVVHRLRLMAITRRLCRRRSSSSDGVLPEHALVLRKHHVARAGGTREGQVPVARRLRKLRLRGLLEGDERPLPA